MTIHDWTAIVRAVGDLLDLAAAIITLAAVLAHGGHR